MSEVTGRTEPTQGKIRGQGWTLNQAPTYFSVSLLEPFRAQATVSGY